jgi:hypothetical protein
VQSAVTWNATLGSITLVLAKGARLDAFKVYNIIWPLRNKIITTPTVSSSLKLLGKKEGSRVLNLKPFTTRFAMVYNCL